MTYLIFLNPNKNFSIKKIKEKNEKLDEVFEMNEDTEYCIPENFYENAINIQIFDDAFPFIRAYNYEYKIEDYLIKVFRFFKGEVKEFLILI